MSSLFDIPAQLAMLLSLAAASGTHAPVRPAPRHVTPAAAVVIEPLDGPLMYGERSWLQALRDNPRASGGYASRVFVTSSGRFYVPTASDRASVLKARNDAALVKRVAQAAAERNAAVLREVLGTPPSAVDLYTAHLLGVSGAVSLLKAVNATPGLQLEDGFPALAESLAELGVDASGMSVGEFYRRLGSKLHEPPRLIAIGLKPTVDDERAHGGGAAYTWVAKVDVAEAEDAPQ